MGVLKCYGNFANIYNILGDFAKSHEYNDKALLLCDKLGDQTGKLKCHMSIGFAYGIVKEYEKARIHINVALNIARKLGDILGEVICLYQLGRTYVDTSLHTAYNYLKEAIGLIDGIGSMLVRQNEKIEFYSNISEIYADITKICLILNNNREAFEFFERGKSRSFVELLSSSNLQIPNKSQLLEAKNLFQEATKYRNQLRLAYLSDIGDADSQPAETKTNFKTILENLNQIHGKLEQIDPEYVSVMRVGTLTVDDVQRVLRRQGNSLVVEYLLTETQIVIFVIGKEFFNVEMIAINQYELYQLLQRFLSGLFNNEFCNRRAEAWTQLSDILIKPISKYLSGSDYVYLVPNGPLYRVPLHALLLEGEPLIVRHPIAYLHSASLLKFYDIHGSGNLSKCTTIGVEPFNAEAISVGGIFGSKPFPDATKKDFLDHLDCDVLHISSHGNFNNSRPLESCMELSDHALTARDVFNLDLNIELVTLSACSTGLNPSKGGDELIGFTRAFIFAGVASVLVSLWDVDAKSTALLMQEFYVNLKLGDNKAVALQKAQIVTMKIYPDPFYWSAFVLIGDHD